MPSVRDTLAMLCQAIESIDGGCPVCIKAFIEEANMSLANNGVHYEFRYDKRTVYVTSCGEQEVRDA